MKDNRPGQFDGKDGTELNGRKVLVGVCGGIAAYKTVELCRLFMKAGARVQVVMTEAATKFVTPLTFETVTARHVFVEMFPAHGEFSPWHTEMATWPDIAVIAPATANHLAQLAAGLADNLLSTVMLTLERPRVLCPSMNPRMWANPATQANLSTLKQRGYRVIMPDEGAMARPGEEEGMGRLVEPDAIFREVCHVLSAPQDLRGVRVLVTAGRTEESWDPVRVLTNRATGRMGFALAEEARERGAEVVLIHGPTDVIPPTGVRIRRIMTAFEMAQAVKQEFHQADIVLMAAAVADYTFAKTAHHKIKKGDPDPEVHLIPTEDILKSLADKKGNRCIVGFALETENLLENALRKLREKHLDFVVANNPLAQGSGFAGETNQVLMIHRSGRVTELPLLSKREAAREILNAVIETRRHPEPEPEIEPEIDALAEEEMLEGGLLSPAHVEAAVTEQGELVPSHLPPSTRPPRHRDRRKNRKRGRRGDGTAPVPPSHGTDNVPSSTAVKSPTTASPMAVSEHVEAIRPADERSVVHTSVVDVEVSSPAGELPLLDLPHETPRKPGKTRRGGRRGGRGRSRRTGAESTSESGVPPVTDSPAPVTAVEAPQPVASAVAVSEASDASPKKAPRRTRPTGAARKSRKKTTPV